MTTISDTTRQDTLEQLQEILRRYERVVVAFSGGVDSGLLAYVATATLGRDAVLCATAISASLAEEERADCEALANEWGLSHRFVTTDELSVPSYVANGTDRCYHCKAELMQVLSPLSELEEHGVIVLGVNLDDLDDHRPGQLAAKERGAAFPLVEAGLTKDDVRQLAKALGLRIWDKPAAACLASRVPHGTPVTLGVLSQVARAESALRELGFRQLRVRHYGEHARIELDLSEIDGALQQRGAIVDALHRVGYRYVTLDLEGFRSGNLARAALEKSA